MIDLNKFCAVVEGRYSIQIPFIRSKLEYATDGKIMVRIHSNKKDTIGQFPAADKLEILFPKIDSTKFKPMPILHIRPVKKPCYDCSGDGKCECSNCANVHMCQSCDGKGTYDGYSKDYVSIEGAIINADQALKISNLEGVEYVVANNNGENYFRFKFVNPIGEGVILCIKKDNLNKDDSVEIHA